MCQEMIDLAGSGVEKYLKMQVKQKNGGSVKAFLCDCFKVFIVVLGSFFGSFAIAYFLLKVVVF